MEFITRDQKSTGESTTDWSSETLRQWPTALTNERNPWCRSSQSGGSRRIGILLLFLCLLFCSTVACKADDAAPSWLPPKNNSVTQVTRVEIPENGSSAHRFRIHNAGVHEALIFKSPRTVSRLHHDFEASINVVASAAGARPGLIIMLPQQIDPRTGQPLQTIIRGDALREIDVAKTLSVKATKQAIDAQMRILRAELHQPYLKAQGIIVIGLAVVFDATPGEHFIEFGEVAYGPVIPPDDDTLALATDAFGTQKSITPAGGTYRPIGPEHDVGAGLWCDRTGA